MMTEKPKGKQHICSEQELVGTFLTESIGQYIIAKNNEHSGISSNKQMKADAKEKMLNLLDGLEDSLAYTVDKKNAKEIISVLRENLDTYIDKMDKELTKSRDVFLDSMGKNNSDPSHKDQAMLEVASISSFSNHGALLKKESDKLNLGTKDTGWKILADAFKGTKLGDFFEKKNEKAKLANVTKEVVLKKNVNAALEVGRRQAGQSYRDRESNRTPSTNQPRTLG